jgi:hypothetical protein
MSGTASIIHVMACVVATVARRQRETHGPADPRLQVNPTGSTSPALRATLSSK